MKKLLIAPLLFLSGCAFFEKPAWCPMKWPCNEAMRQTYVELKAPEVAEGIKRAQDGK